MRFRSLPIFWQTLILLLGGLVMAQLISVLLIVYLPAPRPDFYTMTEIAENLALNPGPGSKLIVRRIAAAPIAEGGMISDDTITRRLAMALDRPFGDVRLFFFADQSETFPFNRQSGAGRRADPPRPALFLQHGRRRRARSGRRLADVADAAAAADQRLAGADVAVVRYLGAGDAALRMGVRASADAADPALRRRRRAARS